MIFLPPLSISNCLPPPLLTPHPRVNRFFWNRIFLWCLIFSLSLSRACVELRGGGTLFFLTTWREEGGAGSSSMNATSPFPPAVLQGAGVERAPAGLGGAGRHHPPPRHPLPQPRRLHHPPHGRGMAAHRHTLPPRPLLPVHPVDQSRGITFWKMNLIFHSLTKQAFICHNLKNLGIFCLKTEMRRFFSLNEVDGRFWQHSIMLVCNAFFRHSMRFTQITASSLLN